MLEKVKYCIVQYQMRVIYLHPPYRAACLFLPTTTVTDAVEIQETQGSVVFFCVCVMLLKHSDLPQPTNG